MLQRVEIRQLGHVIRRQHQGRQVRYGRRQVRRDMIDAVARKQQGSQAGEIREIRQRRDVVIREVDGILILQYNNTLAKKKKNLSDGQAEHRMYIPSRHQDSQWQESYDLNSSQKENTKNDESTVLLTDERIKK